MQVFDSHVHFIDPERPEGVVWPAESGPLRRELLPIDRQQAANGYELSACIAIETSRRPADDQWLLDLTLNEPIVIAAVLNLQPDKAGFESRLEAASKYKGFVGIRLRPIEEYDLSSDLLHRSFALLQKMQKTVEFGATNGATKRRFAELATKYPEMHWILDHCGHPHFDGWPEEAWLRDMRQIAALPNVATKVTVAEGDPESFRPTLQALKDMFGVERLLYGSNWPVSKVDTVQFLMDFFGADAGAFFSDNARRVYDL